MPAKAAQDGSVTVAFRVTAAEAAALGAHPNTAARELVRSHAQGNWIPMPDHLRVLDDLKRAQQEQDDRAEAEINGWAQEWQQAVEDRETEIKRLQQVLANQKVAPGAPPAEVAALRQELAAARQERDGAFALLEQARGELKEVDAEAAHYWDAGYEAARQALAPTVDVRAGVARELVEYLRTHRKPNWRWVADTAYANWVERELASALDPFSACKLVSTIRHILPRERLAWRARQMTG